MTDPVPGLLNPYDISPEEKKSIQMQNLWGALLQGGMGLMAAGSRVSDGQRAQLLMQAAQPFANMGAMNQAMMQSASREKLNAAAAQRLAQQDPAAAEVRQMVNSPEFSAQLDAAPGMNPHMKTLLLGAAKMGNFGPALSAVTPRRGEVPSGYRPAGDGLEAIPGGPADPTVTERLAASKRAMNEKAIPQTVTKGMGENLTSLRKIDDTMKALNENPDSVGGIGSIIAANIPFVGDLQNKPIGDPKGTTLRALIADIGSLKVHDRSGAAVTASETPRLRPFIPSISDDAATVRKKLDNFRTEYLRNLEDTTGYYNQENGFKPYKAAEDYLKGGAQPQARSMPQGMPKAGDVMDGHRFKGGNPADKNNWELAQ